MRNLLRSNRSNNTPYAAMLFAGVVVAWIVLYPIGALVVRSLTDPATGSVSVAAYIDVYTSARTWEAAKNTAIVVVASTSISVIAGTAMAWLLTRTDLPLARFLRPIPIMPLLLPPLLGAAGWIFLLAPRSGFINVGLRYLTNSSAEFGPLNIYSIWGIVGVVSLYCVPYVYAMVQPALVRIDAHLEEAARLSGAGLFRQTVDITLQVAWPAIVAGGVFAIIVSASEFTIPALIGTGARIDVLSTRLYNSATQFPISFEEAASLAMLLLAFVGFATYLQRKIVVQDRYTTIGGKAGTSKKSDLRMWKWPAFALILGYVITAIVVPLGAIAIVSVSPYWTPNLLDVGLTLSHYRFVLIENVGTFSTILNSVGLAFAGATVATGLGLGIAYMTISWRSRLGGVLDSMANISLGVPAIVFGVGALIAFIRPPIILYGTLAALLVGYVAKMLPIAIRPLTSSYVQVGRGMVEASWVAGGTRTNALLEIVAPLVKTGLLSAWGLTFVLLLREMPISIMLSTPNTRVISVDLFNYWEGRTITAVAAYSMVVFLVGLIALVFVQIVGRLIGADLDLKDTRSSAGAT